MKLNFSQDLDNEMFESLKFYMRGRNSQATGKSRVRKLIIVGIFKANQIFNIIGLRRRLNNDVF